MAGKCLITDEYGEVRGSWKSKFDLWSRIEAVGWRPRWNFENWHVEFSRDGGWRQYLWWNSPVYVPLKRFICSNGQQFWEIWRQGSPFPKIQALQRRPYRVISELQHLLKALIWQNQLKVPRHLDFSTPQEPTPIPGIIAEQWRNKIRTAFRHPGSGRRVPSHEWPADDQRRIPKYGVAAQAFWWEL